MADMAFWKELYSTLLTEEKAEALQQRFEDALTEQIEAWALEIFDNIKKEILQKAQTGNYVYAGRTRYIQGEYGVLCRDIVRETPFCALLIEMEKTALLGRYSELRCTELPDGGRRLYFDALRQIGGRIYSAGHFGTAFSEKLEKIGSENWMRIGCLPLRVSRHNGEKCERTEIHVHYKVAI